NWAKLLVRIAKRKSADKTEPSPLILVERMTTYPVDPRRRPLADRADVYLFDGFGLDLDAGQIVPKANGEDLVFTTDDKGGALVAAPRVKLFVVAEPLAPVAKSAVKRVFSQGAVQTSDFAGKYRVETDGRFIGKLELTVDGLGAVAGGYTSEKTGQTYTVVGRAGNPAHKIEFRVSFPMTEQAYTGYLWSAKRDRFVGVMEMEGKPFGFEAVRTE
ncbi:MAG: hypothetical protein ACRDD1_05290, partial [Planctomycetia bacterium]